MRREERLMALALTGALILGGCAAPPPEQTPALSATPAPTAPAAEAAGFALPYYPAGSFHPITGSNRLNLTLAPLLYRGLFSLDRRFRAEKDLCREYSVSEDGSTWSFQLVEAVFSDGSPLTAKEAAASLNQARRSERYKNRLSDIVQVTEGEGETVVVKLERPNGALPALLDVPIVKESEEPLFPLGTGPYYLDREGESYALRSGAGREAPAETIPLRPIRASDDLIYAFDAGEISLVDTDLTSTNALGFSGRLETTDYPTTDLLYLGCNLQKGACREVGVRQAVARSIDRKNIVDRLLAGHGVAATLPIHPYAAGFDGKLAAELDYDMEEAALLLEEAGWRPDEATGLLRRGRSELTLKLVVNQDNTYKVAAAEDIGEELGKLGCSVTVERLSWEDYTAALAAGDFDLFLGEMVLTADFDPEKLLASTGCFDAETYALMDAFRGASGEERMEAASLLYARLVETVPIAPLCFKNGSLLTRWGQVSGAAPTQRDVFAGLGNWRLNRF